MREQKESHNRVVTLTLALIFSASTTLILKMKNACVSKMGRFLKYLKNDLEYFISCFK